MPRTSYSPTGAFCAVHPHRGAVATCDHCGTFACPDCITVDGGRQVCATCIRESRVQVGANPWERRQTLGVIPAAWQTIIAVTSTPARFFSALGPHGTMRDAVLFQVLVLIPALAMGAIYLQMMLLAFGGALLDLLQPVTAQIPAPVMEPIRVALSPTPGSIVTAVLWNMVIGPPVWILIVLSFGVLQHGLLTIVGGAKHDLEVSLKACFYAGGVRFWEVIPLVNWVSLPGLLTVQSIGLARAHEADGWKGLAAGWGPSLSCCCCVFGAVMAFAVFGAAFL